MAFALATVFLPPAMQAHGKPCFDMPVILACILVSVLVLGRCGEPLQIMMIFQACRKLS